MKTCLVTGATGFLGSMVVERLKEQYEVLGVGFNQVPKDGLQVDLRDRDAIEQMMGDVRPNLVVHCAAYRDPDFCEEHPDETVRMNIYAVRDMVEVLPIEARFLYISTDYVFDGNHPPYTEEDAPDPISMYGRSKAMAEPFVLQREGGIVLRVPLLMGAGKTLEQSGFIYQMYQAVKEGKELELDDVLVRHPTWINDVAEAIAFLFQRGESGIFHCSSLRGGTRYAWTREVGEILGMDTAHLNPSSKVIQRKAGRPVNSKLAVDKLQGLGFDHFTDFSEVVRQVLGSFWV